MSNDKMTIDDLAVIVKEGFDGVTDKLDKLETDVTGLKEGQERIELRLDNVAYRFELVALEQRVKTLEQVVLKK